MITAFLGMSLDGFISTSKDTAAKFSSKQDLLRIRKELSYFDQVIMGGSTLKAYSSTLTGYYGKPRQLLYTRSVNPLRYPKYVEQCGEHLPKVISDLTTLTGNTACLGGPTLVKHLLDQKLLTHINMSIAPVILGGGVQAFQKSTSTYTLTLIGSEQIEGTGEVVNYYRINYDNN